MSAIGIGFGLLVGPAIAESVQSSGLPDDEKKIKELIARLEEQEKVRG